MLLQLLGSIPPSLPEPRHLGEASHLSRCYMHSDAYPNTAFCKPDGSRISPFYPCSRVLLGKWEKQMSPLCLRSLEA